jgi:hypothetical protein
MKSRILALCLTFLICIGILPVSVFANYQIDTGTKSYLTLDEDFSDTTGKIWTSIGNPSISSTESKYGGASLYLDGASAISTADNQDFTLGNNDFTYDFYLKIEKTEATTIITQSDEGAVNTSSIYIGANYAGPGSIDLFISNGTQWDYPFHTPSGLVNDGEWHHVAVVRTVDQIMMFVDGNLEVTGNLPQGLVIGDSSYPINIGAQNATNSSSTIHYFKGYLDEFRISPGIARWTEDFVVPSPQPEPEPVDTGRAILSITMTNGFEKEYDLSMSQVNAFLAWYDAKDAGTGPARYAFTKTWNKGPFKSRTEYVIFDKILTFEVNEYDDVTQ